MKPSYIRYIFSNYRQKVESLTDEEREVRDFRWILAAKFRPMMDDALSSKNSEFIKKLEKLCDLTGDFIDRAASPFRGMVECAKKDPAAVKKLFKAVFADDGGDMSQRAIFMMDYMTFANELVAKLFPNTGKYRQDVRTLTIYLFLYDPEHHYMLQPIDGQVFSYAIDYNEIWGRGDNIDMDVYETMCDWAVEQMEDNEDIAKVLTLDKASANAAEKHPDENKHILVADLIHGCHVWNLFGETNNLTVSEQRTNMKTIQNALDLRYQRDRVIMQYHEIAEADKKAKEVLKPGAKILHKKFGEGEVVSYTSVEEKNKPGTVCVSFEGNQKVLSVAALFGDKPVAAMTEKAAEKIMEDIAPILKLAPTINTRLNESVKQYMPYKKVLGEE